METPNSKQSFFQNYNTLLRSAVNAGVPFDDLIQETRNYHGDDFTLDLLKSMRSK